MYQKSGLESLNVQAVVSFETDTVMEVAWETQQILLASRRELSMKQLRRPYLVFTAPTDAKLGIGSFHLAASSNLFSMTQRRTAVFSYQVISVGNYSIFAQEDQESVILNSPASCLAENRTLIPLTNLIQGPSLGFSSKDGNIIQGFRQMSFQFDSSIVLEGYGLYFHFGTLIVFGNNSTINFFSCELNNTDNLSCQFNYHQSIPAVLGFFNIDSSSMVYQEKYPKQKDGNPLNVQSFWGPSFSRYSFPIGASAISAAVMSNYPPPKQLPDLHTMKYWNADTITVAVVTSKLQVQIFSRNSESDVIIDAESLELESFTPKFVKTHRQFAFQLVVTAQEGVFVISCQNYQYGRPCMVRATIPTAQAGTTDVEPQLTAEYLVLLNKAKSAVHYWEIMNNDLSQLHHAKAIELSDYGFTIVSASHGEFTDRVYVLCEQRGEGYLVGLDPSKRAEFDVRFIKKYSPR